MGQDLKAENLAISIPNKGCDKKCPYCISRITGYITANADLMLRNAKKVLNVARTADVTSVLFTGKGEPTLNMEMLLQLAYIFRDYPLELQTNGIKLLSKPDVYVGELFDSGFDTIAVSIDSREQLETSTRLFNTIARLDMVARITLNVTDLLGDLTFKEVISYCQLHDIRQLTIRKVVAPQHVASDMEPVRWIQEHAPESLYTDFMKEVKWHIADAPLLRVLGDGMKVYELDKQLSFVHSDYCIQEQDKGTNVRSLVWLEDGHLYTSWLESAILF